MYAKISAYGIHMYFTGEQQRGGLAMSDQYYVVKKEALPEIYSKIIEVKRLLHSGTAHSVNEAVKTVGISRGAYYKYKDSVFLESEIGKKSIITLSFILEHSPGVLSNLLNAIAARNGNILTINQNIPINGVANVTISIEDQNFQVNLDNLMKDIKVIDGVNEVIVLAKQ